MSIPKKVDLLPFSSHFEGTANDSDLLHCRMGNDYMHGEQEKGKDEIIDSLAPSPSTILSVFIKMGSLLSEVA